MFNLHVGLPGIAAEVMQHPQLGIILGKKFGSRVVQPEVWRANFRTAVNNGEGDSRSTRLTWELAKDTVKELSDIKATAISQPAMLGRSGDCFIRHKPLPNTFDRISHVSSIFGKSPLTIHLTVASQFDYLKMAMERSQKVHPFTVPKIVPSWSELVLRIKDAAPDRKIVVWDFEQPRKTIVAFVVNMLDLVDEEAVGRIYKWISSSKFWDDFSQFKPDMSAISAEMAEELDAQYDADLKDIQSMPDVYLLGASRIPEEFHI